MEREREREKGERERRDTRRMAGEWRKTKNERDEDIEKVGEEERKRNRNGLIETKSNSDGRKTDGIYGRG